MEDAEDRDIKNGNIVRLCCRAINLQPPPGRAYSNCNGI